jgi:ABC-2 type transport system ATP-binding protein
MAQVNDPDLLILDEPASALDPVGRKAVLDVMARLREHTTIFYSTHILDDVQRVSDTVAILNRGQLVASGPIEQILKGKDGVIYTMALKGARNSLSERLAKLPWVTHMTAAQHNGTSVWQVSVSDEAAAEKDLLRHILADPAVRVTEFNRKTYELEEVFMDIVKGEEHVR